MHNINAEKEDGIKVDYNLKEGNSPLFNLGSGNSGFLGTSPGFKERRFKEEAESFKNKFRKLSARVRKFLKQFKEWFRRNFFQSCGKSKVHATYFDNSHLHDLTERIPLKKGITDYTFLNS